MSPKCHHKCPYKREAERNSTHTQRRRQREDRQNGGVGASSQGILTATEMERIKERILP